VARYEALAADGLAKAQALARWRQALQRGWSGVRVEDVKATGADPMHVGSALEVAARVSLGPFSPDDVEVQLFHGLLDSLGDIPRPATVSMSHNGQPIKASGGRESPGGNVWLFQGTIPCRTSGQHGYAVRVLPRHPDLSHAFEPGLVCWG
jgi:starch phosphorylase